MSVVVVVVVVIVVLELLLFWSETLDVGCVSQFGEKFVLVFVQIWIRLVYICMKWLMWISAKESFLSN